jgi:adenylate cyclase
MIAGAQASIRIFIASSGDADNGLAAAERAIALDPNLAEAHAVRAEILASNGRHDEALREIELALKLDPDAYEVNVAVARAHFSARRVAEAVRCWEKATASMEGDYHAAGMLIGCYDSLGDEAASRRAAERALARAEKVVATEPDNGSAMSFIVTALGALGEKERAAEWIERGTLLDPHNQNMYYNFACTLATSFRDPEGAIDLLAGIFKIATIESLNWFKIDPDLDSLRDHPRFKAMLAAAQARLAAST